MKERPILFSGEMVRAILAGRKTQTRRIMKPQPSCEFHPEQNGVAYRYCPTRVDKRTGESFPGGEIYGVADENEDYPSRFGMPGDRLWVKETFMPDPYVSGLFVYRATEEEPDKYIGHDWKPSIFMARRANRITLQITGVRAERLQDISESDARAEGIEGRFHPKDCNCWTWKDYARSLQFKEDIFHYGSMVTPQSTYCSLWESINGHGSWLQNPWVWVIEFRMINGSNVK